MLSFLLVPLYTTKGVLSSVAEYGEVSVIFSYFVLFNVILAYGMETAFFRFFNKEPDKNKVTGTVSISLIVTSVGFFVLGFLFKDHIANLIEVKAIYLNYVFWILLLDALTIIPFAWLRATEQPMRFALIKIFNVVVNIGLNLFFLLALKNLVDKGVIFKSLYVPDFGVSYILISNVIASGVTLLLMMPFYARVKYIFNFDLWKSMMKYGIPVLIAGIAFSINETFDRILLNHLLPEDVAKTQIGLYSACYKLALFMTLFATAYRLGIEPFFFSHAKAKNPQKNYALILEFFVIFGSIILLGAIVFVDVLKVIIVRGQGYWEAMWIVPLVLIANFCLGIYHNLSVWYKITDRTKFGAYISIFGALVTLVLNFWLIPIIGYRGSAIATLAAYASMMFLSFYFGRKYYPIPYNLKKIGLYMGSSIILSLLSFYEFRGDYVIGVSMLIVFLGIVYYSEQKIIKQLLIRKHED